MSKKSLLSLALAAALAFGSCSAVFAEEESVVADEVSIALGADISTLEPWNSATEGRLNVLPTLYEYMCYYDSSTESGLAGILMNSFERIDDTTVRIGIYDYIYDSAGNHMTASDVKFSMDTWKENGKSVKCKLLDSVTVVDDYTVEIKMTTATVGELENILCGLVPIVTEAAYEASGDNMVENVISTSPYVVTDYVSGSSLTVEKRDDYWQTDESLILPVSQANVEKITWNIVTEKSQMAINLETNAVDMTTTLSYSEASRFMEGGESSEGYHVTTAVAGSFYFLSFNCSEGGMFDHNVALRQAIMYGIDSYGIVEGALYGQGDVLNAFANRVCMDYDTSWDEEDWYGYDMTTAQELIKESGFDTSTTIRLMASSVTDMKAIAQIVQSYLMALGLNVELEIYDSTLFQTYKTDPTQWDLILDGQQSVDYVTSAASCFSVDAPAKNLIYDDETMEAMIAEIVTPEGHTAEKIDEYMQYVKDQAYIYPICVPYNFIPAEEGITSVFTNFKGWIVPGACTYSADFTR